MKWTAEADLEVGLAVGSGKRRLGVGLGIGRRKIIKNIGLDLEEHKLKRCRVFILKNSTVLSLNWSLDTRNSVYLDRDKAMKRGHVFNLLLQMIPSSHHPVAPSSSDHWAFLEEVDAPQWADLGKEAALMGTLGDDPWFHRWHLHHETSLARAENLATVSDSNGSSIEIPIRGGKGTGSVAKLIKPTLKAHVVKACIGRGMQRVSNGSSNGRGRLSPRLSNSLSRSKYVKKVNIIQRSGLLLQQQQKIAGSDPRQANNEPGSKVEPPTRSIEGKPNGNGVQLNEPLLKNAREAAAQKILGRRGSSVRSKGLRPVGGESDNASLKGSESVSTQLPAVLGQGVGDISRTDLVEVKSSPSDMYLSSDASPRQSISSQESLARAVSVSAAEVARRKILAEGRKSTQSRESLEIPWESSLPSGEISEVLVNEPHLEITSFNSDDVPVDKTSTTNGGPDWNSQQEPNPVVAKKNLGPPMRVKVIENGGSSSDKKKGSSRENNSRVGAAGSPKTENRGSSSAKKGSSRDSSRDGAAGSPETEKGRSSSAKKKGSSRDNNSRDGAAGSPEKNSGLQATHPILEKLRKSWGSALRVKQRHDAEASLSSDARSDTSTENSVDLKVGSNVTTRKKWDQAQVQPEVVKSVQSQQAGAATTNQPPSEREALIRNIITRERRAAITQQQQQLLQQQPPQQLRLITDAGVLASPSRSANSSNSENVTQAKTTETTTESKRNRSPNTEKAGLTNHQRSKSEMPSKFKKQYLHADTGMSKSLSMQRGNKENMQLEVKVPSPPTGFAWKRKPAVPTRKQLSPRNLSTGVNGARMPSQAAARRSTAHTRPSLTQTSPPAKNLVIISKSAPPFTSTTKTVSLDAADFSVAKLEALERKSSNLAILRGSSTSSERKLTKQKSEKISSLTLKEALANTAGPKASRNSGQVADLSVVVAAEDRKSKLTPKYEPRVHSVRAIREWERNSGKRYYDLPPIERKKVNQEISAALAAALKTVERKKSSAR